jgi:protein SCO1
MIRKSRTSSLSSARSTVTDRPRQRGRALTLVLVVAAALSLPAAIWIHRESNHDPLKAWAAAPPDLQAVLWPEPRAVADFRLQTQHGAPFTNADLEGRWSFMFFGYLTCPDVCPTTLHVMRELRSLLRSIDRSADQHQFIFVSVDPERDRPAAIGPYLAHFDAALIGLSGPDSELERLAQPLAVRYIEVVDAESGARGIDHTSSLLVVDPYGRVVAAFSPPHRPERMRDVFQQLRRYTRS